MQKKKILLIPYFFNLKLIEGAYAGAERYGLALSVAQPSYFATTRPWKKYDGILTASIRSSDRKKLQEDGCKVICLSLLDLGDLPEKSDATVAVDESQICLTGINYFLRKGFSNFACCLDPKREELFRLQTQKSGIENVYSFSPSPIPLEVDLKSRIEFVRNLPKPCAFIVQTLLWSERWNEVIHRSGVKVPEELSILGIDNHEYICNVQSPRLSAIDTNSYELGFRAVETMAKLLNGESVPHKTLIAPQKRVVERESSDFYAVRNKKLRQIIVFIRAHIGEGLTVRSLAEEFSVTVQAMDALFLRHLWTTPKRFLIEQQLMRAEELLRRGDLKIAEVARESGFVTQRNFYDFFREYHNTSPKEWCCRNH